MADLKLVIGSKNSSSWSLRPWLLLKQVGLEFEEALIPLRRPETAREIARHSPSGKVPVLLVDGVPIWDSLAICEFAAEQIEGLWPEEPKARALARSVSAEMHAGFPDLRAYLPLDVTARFGPPGRLLSGVARDVERIQTIWRECRQLSATQGPFLFGQFTVADAMYAPVAFRFHTYQVPLNAVSSAYVRTLLELPAMQEWAAAAQAEVSGGAGPTLRLGPGPEGAPPSPGGQARAMPAAPPPAASGRADAGLRPAAPARPAPDSRAMAHPEPRRPEPPQALPPQPESAARMEIPQPEVRAAEPEPPAAVPPPPVAAPPPERHPTAPSAPIALRRAAPPTSAPSSQPAAEPPRARQPAAIPPQPAPPASDERPRPGVVAAQPGGSPSRAPAPPPAAAPPPPREPEPRPAQRGLGWLGGRTTSEAQGSPAARGGLRPPSARAWSHPEPEKPAPGAPTRSQREAEPVEPAPREADERPGHEPLVKPIGSGTLRRR